MIKVRKSALKYAEIVKVSSEACTDVIFLKNVLSDLKLRTVPKNTLKIVPMKTIDGLHKDDFVKNLRTFRREFLVYTFKR